MRVTAKSAGISKLAAPIVIIVIVAVVGGYYFLQQPTTPTPTQSSTSSTTTSSATTGTQPAVLVKTEVDQMVQKFNTRDAAGLVNYYDQNAVVVWGGKAGGLEGTYSGAGNIRILYGSTIGKTTTLTASLNNYTEKAVSPTNVNVTISISMKGNSSVVGGLNATVIAIQNWLYRNGQWQIVKENWNYKTYSVQFPLTGTTFPQWGLMREGKSPDIVSEKSLEWRAGPFVAAAVYALVGIVVGLTVLRFKSRPRTV